MHRTSTALAAAIPCLAVSAHAHIVGQYHVTWCDDPQSGVYVIPHDPTPGINALFHLDAWHLDQASTAAWYDGLAVPGMPPNPFDAANRDQLTAGSIILPIVDAEAFIYQITNLNYDSGNPRPTLPPFSFSDPDPHGFRGWNGLSGFSIANTHGAPAQPAAASHFMLSGIAPRVLDLTPTSTGIPNSQDWDLTAPAVPAAWEWTLDTEGVGALPPEPTVVFGFALPGTWLGEVSPGQAHSWTLPQGDPWPVPLVPVNIAHTANGFWGPAVPSPAAAVLLALASLTRRRPRT